MKIGILTFHRAVNYGAFIQAYALSKVIEGMGYDVEVIDYEPSHCGRYRSTSLHRKWFKHYRSNLQKLAKRREFTKQVIRHLPLTKKHYSDLNHLQSEPPSIDVCICGSDQIWNPKRTSGFDGAFFADFNSIGMKRIAYAASFGISTMPPEYEQQFLSYVDKFDAVSVRENSGACIIEDLTSIRPNVVLDPSLLLEDYNEIICEHLVEQEYILFLAGNVTPRIRTISDHLHKIISIPILELSNTISWDCKKDDYVYGPNKLLGLIKNAQCVVTDSFHALTLSISFQKPFYYVPLEGGIAERSCRITDLFDQLEIRMNDVDVRNILSYGEKSISSYQCNWSNINRILNEQREYSRQFLKNSIEHE